MSSKTTALSRQVGGAHYKGFAIQPVEFALVNNLNTAQANIIKYILRDKNSRVDDIGKAIHYAELWLDVVQRYGLPGHGKALENREVLGLPVIPLHDFIRTNGLSVEVGDILLLVVDKPSARRIRLAISLMGNLSN